MAKILSSIFRLPLFIQSRLGKIYPSSIFINSLWKLVEIFSCCYLSKAFVIDVKYFELKIAMCLTLRQKQKRKSMLFNVGVNLHSVLMNKQK